MHKDFVQKEPKKNYQDKRKEKNQKIQKKRQIKVKIKKPKDINIKKDYESSKENVNNKKNVEKENISKIISIKENNIPEKIEKDKNKNISKLSNNDIRFFGKELNNNSSSLEERFNQYIIKGSDFKKYISNNFILNPNINKINDNTDEALEIINIKYINNPQYAIQYRSDIFHNLIREENNNIPNYTELINIIDEDTRNKYIIFLITVCDKITQKEEIHYLSINIFDRVICKLNNKKEKLSEKKLQLICFTSLFIAYKYETGCYFLIDDLLKHTEDSLVEKDEVLQFEYEINKILNFEYLIVYPSHFLKHFDLIDNINNPKIFYFCLYLIDFILSDINLMSNKKSLISASCYYIAKANLLKINAWPNIFQFITGYSKNEIKQISIKIIKALKNSKNSEIFKCLKKKYSKDEYFKVIDSIISKK